MADIKSFGSSIGQSSDAHLTVEKRVTYAPTVNRADATWTGPYSKLLGILAGIKIGDSARNGDFDLPEGSSDSNGDFGPCRYSGAVLNRTPGNNGRLVVSVVQTVHSAVFGIDWVEVSKPIRTWHADKADGAPDLGKIREWETQKEGNPKAYWGDDENNKGPSIGSTELEGDTLELARFIAKGIETYSLYAPVFTISLTIDQANRGDEGGLRIGSIGDPQCPYGWKDARGRSAEDIYGNYANPVTGNPYTWMLVKSTITPNADGTHQWNLAWQGADSIDEKLYTLT